MFLRLHQKPDSKTPVVLEQKRGALMTVPTADKSVPGGHSPGEDARGQGASTTFFFSQFYYSI